MPPHYSKATAIAPARGLGFIQTKQPKLRQSLAEIYCEEPGMGVLDHLMTEMETNGILKALRQGFKCYGKLLRVAVFASHKRMNPDTLTFPGQNELSVTRQLYYGSEHSKLLDLVLFLDGLSEATTELKNPLSGQTVTSKNETAEAACWIPCTPSVLWLRKVVRFPNYRGIHSFANGGYKAACHRAAQREERWSPSPPPVLIKGLTLAQWACVIAGLLAFFSPLIVHPEAFW